MMKKFEKRLLSLVLAIVMVLSLFTVTASANSEAHPSSIIPESDGVAVGVEIYMIKELNELLDNGANNTQYFVDHGDSYDLKALAPTGCGAASKYTGAIENILEEEITISFDYSYDGQEILFSKSFDYTDASQLVLDSYKGDGTYSVTLAQGETLYITLNYAQNTSGNMYTTFTISNLHQVISTEHDVTIIGSVGGKIICGGDRIGAGSSQVYPLLPSDSITVNAVADSGYNFVAFVDPADNSVISQEESYTFSTTTEMSIAAYFVYKGTQAYRSGSLNAGYHIFDDFNAAAQVAADTNGIFMPLQDFTLPAGEYSIPEGATLLIPFDEDSTCYRATPGNVQDVSGAKNPKPFRVLTLANGAHITVNGSISVSAKHFAASSNAPAGLTTVVGYYGQIDMKNGSSIDLMSGSNLYAWGYITGEFSNGGYDSYVNANDGSTVYELFQIADWRGGTATMNIASAKNRVFPFCQYYIQNIETNLVCRKGATEKFTGSLIASDSLGQASATFIGDEGLFNIVDDNATISKYYNPVEDKLYFDLNAANDNVDADLAATLCQTLDNVRNSVSTNPEFTSTDFVLSKINLRISVPGLVTTSLDSSDFLLPINNMDITIDDAVVVVTNEIELLPDSRMTVGENCRVALLTVKKEMTETAPNGETVVTQKEEPASVYLIDAQDWKAADPINNNQGFASAEKSISQLYYSPSRDKDGSKRTVLRNSSKLQDAQLNVNGQILSMGNYNTGKSGLCTTSGGASIISSNGTGQIMFFNAAGLADTCYASNQYIDDSVDLGGGGVQLKNDDGSYTVVDNSSRTSADISPELKAEMLEQCKLINPSRYERIYNNQYARMLYCVRYYLKQDSNGDYAWYKNKMNSEADRDFVPATTFKNEDGTVLYQGWASYGTAAQYKGAVPVKASDASNSYTFDKWTPSISDPVTEDTVYTATFKATAITYYTVKWANEDGTVIETDKVTYGTIPSFDSPEPTKSPDEYYYYEFAGWDKPLDPVTGDITFTAVFDQTVRTYTVKWLDNDGTEIFSEELTYGVVPFYDGIPATKPSDDDGYSWVFSSWTPDVTAVTGNAEYTAVYDHSYNGSFIAHSLTLKGKIGVNFFVKMSPDKLDGQKVKLTVGSETSTVYLEDLADKYDEEMGAYKVQAFVSAPEMTDNISAKLYSADDTLISADNYKVASYADKAFATVTDNTLKELVRAMLNYGAESQRYFNHHETELADSHLDSAVQYSSVTLADVAARLAAANSGEASTDAKSSEVQDALAAYGVQYTGMSLVLESDTVIRLYFSVTDADKLSAAEITLNGKSVEPTACESGVYFDCSVPAAELDELMELQIGDVSIKCCALDYMVQALEGSSSDAQLMSVLEALYWYNVYADNYFTL